MKTGDILTLEVSNPDHTQVVFVKWESKDIIEVKCLKTNEELLTHYKSVVAINGVKIG